MISSISTNLNQVTSELVAAKQNNKITTDTEGKETVDNSLFDSAPAPRTDTLEISPEGLAAAYAQTSTDTSSSDASTQFSSSDASTSSDAAVLASITSDETTTTSATTSKVSDAGTPPPPPPISSTEETDSTDSSSSTKDLSSYSDDELDDLVDDGVISETEKNTELARRAMEESLEKNQDKMLEQQGATEASGSTPPPKPKELDKDSDLSKAPPIGDDLALTKGAATEATE